MERVVLLLGCVAPVALCYSSGQVKDSCGDLRPHHSGLSPQTGPPPFSITTDHITYRLGDQVKVQLLAPASTPFIGFLLQAREVGGASLVGSFVLTRGAAQPLTCSQRLNSAVAHRSASAKTSIEVSWRSEPLTAVQFHASFVQNYSTFWVDVSSPVLNFTDARSPSVTPATISSTTAPRTPAHPASPAKSISSDDCGLTKVCLSQPLDCDPAVREDCYFLSAMLSLNNAAVRYEVTGPSDGYISFGFSDDQMMGNDDIYICGIGSHGLVEVQHAFSTGQTLPQSLPLGNVSDVRASVQDNVISCAFTSMNTISTQMTTGVNKAYHLMYAHGPSRNGKIQFHTATFTSINQVDISRPQLVRTAGLPHIIKAHGALMLTAWMSMGSLGMMVARYLRGVANRQTQCGKDVWFLVHVTLMSLTITATTIGFILSFSHVRAWSGGAHPVLGCLVMILSSLQLLLALLRCGPHHPLRFVFNWSHALNGLAIKALSVAAIFTGFKLIDSTPDQWLMKVMGGFVGLEALFFICLDAHLKWKLSLDDTLGSKTKMINILLITMVVLGNMIFLVALLVGISLS